MLSIIMADYHVIFRFFGELNIDLARLYIFSVQEAALILAYLSSNALVSSFEKSNSMMCLVNDERG